MKLTKEKAKELEIKHNVYINMETLSYNYDGYETPYGWFPIPIKWFTRNENLS